MNNRYSFPPVYDYMVSMLFFFLFLVLFTTLSIAISFYGEPFLFWQDAFSDLGNTVTKSGHPNTASMVVMIIGLTVESIIMFKISFTYSENQQLRNRTMKHWLAFLGGVGYLVSIVPNNLNHVVHSIGIGTVIGVLYFFTMIFHFELKPVIPSRLFFIDMIIVHAVVLSYAAAFFTDSIHKQSLQKICIIGLCLILQRILMTADDSFASGDMLDVFKRFQH